MSGLALVVARTAVRLRLNLNLVFDRLTWWRRREPVFRTRRTPPKQLCIAEALEADGR